MGTTMWTSIGTAMRIWIWIGVGTSKRASIGLKEELQ